MGQTENQNNLKRKTPDGIQSDAGGDTTGPQSMSLRLYAASPWLISIAVHVLFVAAAGFVVWSSFAAPEEPVVIPLVNLSATPGFPLEARQEPSESNDQADAEQPAIQEPVESIDQIILSSRIDLDNLMEWNQSVDEVEPLFDNTFADYLDISFFGSGGNARRIVFVVDTSGSLIDTHKYVIRELRRAISTLKPLQEFTVIFFQGDRVIEVPEFGLKRADPMTKNGVIEWIDPANHHIEQWGKTDPLPALERAISYEPQLIYLFSDQIVRPGPADRMLEEQTRLLDQIKRLNRHHTRISTIQFMYHDPLADLPGSAGTMQLIAKQTGGTYRFITEDDLLKQPMGESEPIP